MARFVQDKVNQPSPQTRIVDTENQVNCLSVNKDFSLAVVAGRSVFKVYNLDEEKITERYNLRAVQRMNLTYGASDVAWSPHDDNVIASASTNGCVVFWNLSKSSKNKQEQVLQLHDRSVNRLSFHPQEPYLLSCANDGVCKLSDLRQKSPAVSFQSALAHMYDVKWWPKEYFRFAAAVENGNILIWDYRQSGSCYKEFPAHNGPIFALDFHPEEKNWLASSGRDKLIKVWNLSDSQPITSRLHQISAIAGVSKIKWRPERSNQIASTAMNLDFGVNIWDLGRPFIPVATFNEHKNVASSIVWKNPHVFLTAGKDNLLIEHVFRDANRPASRMTPVALATDLGHHYSLAVNRKLTSGSNKVSPASQSTSTMIGSFFRQNKPDKREEFISHNYSIIFSFSAEQDLQDFDPDWFVYCAKNYQLHGRSFEELCQHNCDVASKQGRSQVASHWVMLKVCFSLAYTSPARSNVHNLILTDLPGTHSALDGLVKGEKQLGEGTLENGDHMNSGLSDPEDSADDLPDCITSQAANQDFFYEDNDIDGFELDTMDDNPSDEEDLTLPPESFLPPHELTDGGDLETHASLHQQASLYNPGRRQADRLMSEGTSQPEKVQVTMGLTDLVPFWDPTHSTAELVNTYAEIGDVQTAVSMVIVLGSKIRSHINESSLERWLLSYIELLHRFKLWSEATTIIKRCKVKDISQMNQESTSFHTVCGRCNKPIAGTNSWYCNKCNVFTSLCALCHIPVKGSFVWCQGCAHGGHLAHMKSWFRENKTCPTGCGHLCQYT